MAAGVPPPPLNSPAGSYYWLEWYTNLTNFLNGTNVPWSNINFSGSNLTDLQTRLHNSLQSIQGGNAIPSTGGGNAYHLIGYGYSSANGSSSQVPVGWSVNHSATGTYVITHNLGLNSPNYMGGATANSTGAIVSFVDLSSGNAIVVHTVNTTSPGTAVDSNISFWVGAM